MGCTAQPGVHAVGDGGVDEFRRLGAPPDGSEGALGGSALERGDGAYEAAQLVEGQAAERPDLIRPPSGRRSHARSTTLCGSGYVRGWAAGLARRRLNRPPQLSRSAEGTALQAGLRTWPVFA